jgi:hypothetical protein
LLSAGDEAQAPASAFAGASGQQGGPLPTGSGSLGPGRLVQAVLHVNPDTQQVRLQLHPVASLTTPPRASASPMTGLERFGSAMLNLSGMFSGLTGRQSRRPHASEAGFRGADQAVTAAAAADVAPGKHNAAWLPAAFSHSQRKFLYTLHCMSLRTGSPSARAITNPFAASQARRHTADVQLRSPSSAQAGPAQSESPFLLPSLNTSAGQALMQGPADAIAEHVRSTDLPELVPSESPHVRGPRQSATTLASARPTADMSEAGARTVSTPVASLGWSSMQTRGPATQPAEPHAGAPRRDVWSDNPAFSAATTPHSSINPSLDPVPVRAPFPPALTPAAGNTPTRLSQPLMPRTPGTPEPLESSLPAGV